VEVIDKGIYFGYVSTQYGTVALHVLVMMTDVIVLLLIFLFTVLNPLTPTVVIWVQL